MKNKRAAGAEYELQAARHLEKLGYKITARNFRCRQGEIDLVAEEGAYLVFIEVKYRKNIRMGEPQEAVDFRKQRSICRTAAFYCSRYGISEQQPCRFDVAAYTEGKWTIIKNAFEFIS